MAVTEIKSMSAMAETEIEPISAIIADYIAVKKHSKGEVLRFEINEGRDVYNCSVPFEYNGKTYIWGRVEKREEWATSVTMLFEQNQDGVFVRAAGAEVYPLEDPFFVQIKGEYILGGTHVVKDKAQIKTYYVYFYRGNSPFSLKYFTTGPDYMKDVRLVELSNGRIGVFSRPRNDEIFKKYGTVSQIGYTEIDSLDELDAEVIDRAAYIPGCFAENEWGGVNQAIALRGSYIGLIGHQGYTLWKDKKEYPIYVKTAYVYDSACNRLVTKNVIGVLSDYPPVETKTPVHIYCAFTSGIVGSGETVRLYSGLGDSHEGWIEIPDPFRDYR